ncbi:unnamed protein product [Linum tenue]|uniref:F-box domain-containing protein n=1 Tax=Linum tenue TaxID=586396 RepID=A0AAV0HVP5_9ROSI|nr:unnamed protein product [Linum tenue]
MAEVLIRAPEPGSAWRCKAVCKRWNSLISDTHFVRRYVSHHQQSSSNQYGGGGELEEPPLMSSNSRESILSFLPLPDGLAYEPVYFRVYDCYKDLVLCGFHEGREIRDEFCRSLFVCNPFTKQWIALPLAPETPSTAIGLKEARSLVLFGNTTAPWLCSGLIAGRKDDERQISITDQGLKKQKVVKG